MRKIYTLVVIAVVMFMTTIAASVFCYSVDGDASQAEQTTLMAEGDGGDSEEAAVAARAGIAASEGIIGNAPQVPQTIPVRRIMPSTLTGSGFSVSRIIRMHHNLSLRQLAQCADKLLSSLCCKHSTVFTGAVSPYNFTRSCEYYVYALRVIVI